jgi:hypothetical protein
VFACRVLLVLAAIAQTPARRWPEVLLMVPLTEPDRASATLIPLVAAPAETEIHSGCAPSDPNQALA